MSAYYNEFDPFAAQWLRNLIAAGLIPAGDVDERDIREVAADDVRGYDQCHFFAGIGGWALALRLAAWTEDVPVWTGSCPCQPFSAAGKRKGTADERHLWPEFRRLIAECNPPVVFGEQVASKDGRIWLAGVRTDLEALGYGVGAADLCAACVGAPHIRQRLWWVAESAAIRRCSHRLEAESGRRERATRPDDSDVVGGMADAKRPERRTNGCARINDIDRTETGRSERTGGLELCRPDCRLGSPNLARLPLPKCDELPGPEPLDEGRATLQPGGASGSESDHWSDCTIWPCSDGKSRRVGAGVQPLAHGIPISLGRGRAREQRLAIRAARANRVGRLRGYGNAIVPEVAAEFIRAFLEVKRER